jgi:diacylglycerol kinase
MTNPDDDDRETMQAEADYDQAAGAVCVFLLVLGVIALCVILTVRGLL